MFRLLFRTMLSIKNKPVAFVDSFPFPSLGANDKQSAGATNLFHNMIMKNKGFAKFAQVSNDVCRNKDLSLKAKGLFLILASLPEDWVIHKTQLCNFSNGGKHETIKAFNELINVGLIIPVGRIRANGRFKNWDYIVYPEPQLVAPIADFQTSVNQTSEKPTLENQQLTNTDITNIELTKKKTTTKRGASTTPPNVDSFSLTDKNIDSAKKKPLGARPEPPTQKDVLATFKKVFAKYDSWNNADLDEGYQFFWYYDARNWELSGGKPITYDNLWSSIVVWMKRADKGF